MGITLAVALEMLYNTWKSASRQEPESENIGKWVGCREAQREASRDPCQSAEPQRERKHLGGALHRFPKDKSRNWDCNG